MVDQKSTTNGAKSFSEDQLNAALLALDDLMSRCILNDTYVLLKDTALALKEGRLLFGDGIYAGVKELELTPEARTTIEQYYPNSIGEKEIKFEVDGVPVTITIMRWKYGFMKYPDTKFYLAEEYQLPNPFDVYWKVRHIVK